MNSFLLDAVKCKYCQRLCYFQQSKPASSEESPQWLDPDAPPLFVACTLCKRVFDYRNQKPQSVPVSRGTIPGISRFQAVRISSAHLMRWRRVPNSARSARSAEFRYKRRRTARGESQMEMERRRVDVRFRRQYSVSGVGAPLVTAAPFWVATRN